MLKTNSKERSASSAAIDELLRASELADGGRDFAACFRGVLDFLGFNKLNFSYRATAPEVAVRPAVSPNASPVASPYVRRSHGGITANMTEVLEYYQRNPKNSTVHAIEDSLRRKELKNGFVLQVNDKGFSIVQIDAKGKESLVGQDEFRGTLSKNSEFVKSFSSEVLPNAILHSGPSSWLFSVYEPEHHSAHIYGIKINKSTVQLEYLYRVKLFSEGLASPPFIVPGGPTTVYKGVDGKVYAYWYLEESNDVEKIFVSKEPLEGDLKDPAIDKDGNLTFTCGDKSHSHAVFFPAYWQKHLERVRAS